MASGRKSADVNAATLSVPQHRSRGGERRRERRYALALVFTVVLAAGVAVRFWHLGVSPGWQWDEAIYLRVGQSVQAGVLQEHPVFGAPWVPFLYQPPLYFVLLARWFDAVGASMYHARVLGVAATTVMLALLYRLLVKIHGSRTALVAMIPVVFDGWLMYIERASYIENVLMVIIVAALLLYQRALDRPAWYNFVLAGIGIGCAASFKQTGAYVLASALLCWLIIRREHRGHLLMLGVALAVIIVYLVAMVRMYDVPGHPWYLDQSLVQVRRVLGLQSSGGTLTSPAKLLHLLVAQYKYFVPSFLIAVIALLAGLRRLLQCYRARNWLPARSNALLFSWFSAGVVVFGFSSLKFPQYFALILIPGYCYLWTELSTSGWPAVLRTGAPVAAALAGLASLFLVLPAFQANPLKQVQQYAAASIPAQSVVVTEESIGDLIQQRWCTVESAAPCQKVATYAITWQTYLQSSFSLGDASFLQLMKGAVKVRTFSGPVGTATVWKLTGPR
jgi:4-amino-4-deoxy-L-arabinose transferase-like glycosyltransferase